MLLPEPKRAPADSRLVHFMDERRSLCFRFRRQDPINCAADAQTRQLRKTLAAFSAHAESRCDLLERGIAFAGSSFLFRFRS